LLAIYDEVLLNEVEEGLVLEGVVELDYVLDEVVAVGILDEEPEVVEDAIGQPQLLFLAPLLQAALHDAAAVLVAANLGHVAIASLKNELGALSGLFCKSALLEVLQLAENGLDHVVAVGVQAQLHGCFLAQGAEQGLELSKLLLSH
jgi:hypothetical protein